MMRARSLLGGVVLGLAASAVACAQILGDFDDNGTTGTGGETSSHTSASSGKATSTAATGSSSAATTGTGGSVASTASSSSSSSSSSGIGCVDPANPCDCDGDGDNANTPECGFDGGDCNDHDPLVNSKQTMWFDVPGSNGWDYDCDGKDEYEYPDTLICKPQGCDTSTQKWSGGSVPDCGQMGPYATCTGNMITCVDGQNLGVRTQGCH